MLLEMNRKTTKYMNQRIMIESLKVVEILILDGRFDVWAVQKILLGDRRYVEKNK